MLFFILFNLYLKVILITFSPLPPPLLLCIHNGCQFSVGYVSISYLANLSFSLPVKKKSGHLSVAFQLTPMWANLNQCSHWSCCPFCRWALGINTGLKLGAYRQTFSVFLYTNWQLLRLTDDTEMPRYTIGSQALLETGTKRQISYIEINKTFILDPSKSL